MSDHKQKILSSKTIFKAKLFNVRELEIGLPNGRKAIHHVVDRNAAVYVFPLTPKYELYFATEYSYNTDEIVMQVPAGFVEKGENILQAAKRELQEETGIIAGQWEEFSRLELAKTSLNAPVFLFLARDLEIKKSNPEETEDIKVIKMPLVEAVGKVMSGEIRKAAVIAGILMLDKLRQQKRL